MFITASNERANSPPNSQCTTSPATINYRRAIGATALSTSPLDPPLEPSTDGLE